MVPLAHYSVITITGKRLMQFVLIWSEQQLKQLKKISVQNAVVIKVAEGSVIKENIASPLKQKKKKKKKYVVSLCCPLMLYKYHGNIF